jgi:hypothetical protein
MAALRPLVEPTILKKKTKMFMQHQTDKLKLSVTSRKPEVLTTGDRS